MEQWVRNAIARIDVVQDGRSISRGTGTLIGQRTVLTALHVVADRHSDPPTPHPGEITLTFPSGPTSATILGRLMNAKADWVILECANPPEVEPVPMDSVETDDVTWETFGFPDANPRDGMVQSGTIESVHAELDGQPVHQLFSKQAAAGDGAPVKGFSGAPVLVQDHIVGVLRFALMKDNRAVAGTLYACPSSSVAIRRTAAIKLVHRSRWRWLAPLPLFLPLGVAAVLHFVPVAGADVRLDARVSRVGMVLSGTQQILTAPLRLDTLRAFYLREALLPAAGAAGARVVEEMRLDVMTREEGGVKGTIGLDETPIPGGTKIIFERSTAPNEYVLALTGLVPELTLSVDGPLRFRTPGGEDEPIQVRLETVTLRPDSGGIELYLSPLSGVPLDPIGPLEVEQLDFTRFSKGEATQTQRSTILGGRLLFPEWGGEGDSVSEGDLLALHGARGRIRITRVDPAGLVLTFEGRINRLGSSTWRMPTQLGSLLRSQLPIVIGVTVAYLVFAGVLIRRRMRRAL